MATACSVALLRVQATGMVPDTEDTREGVLRGLLLIGDLNVDPSGWRLPWPIPPIGFGNAAHLANIADANSQDGS